MIYSAVGKIEGNCDKTFVITKKNEVGYAIYGPYEQIMPGEYKITFCVEQNRTEQHLLRVRCGF